MKSPKFAFLAIGQDPGLNDTGWRTPDLPHDWSIEGTYLDITRPVTAGLVSVLMSNESGYAKALDVTGYNYQESHYAEDHQKYPKRIIYESENGIIDLAGNKKPEFDFSNWLIPV